MVFKTLSSIGFLAMILAAGTMSAHSQPSPQAVSKIEFIAVDKDSRFVADLKKNEIVLTVGGKKLDDFELTIEEPPVAMVLAVDNSGSLRLVFDQLLESMRALFPPSGSPNLVLLMRFVSADKIQVAEKFSSDPVYLESKLSLFHIEGGQTALVEAIYRATQIAGGQRNLAGNVRRAVVVITDGEDRDSSYTQEQLRELIEKERVSVYFVGLTSRLSKSSGPLPVSPRKKAEQFIETIASESGGHVIYPSENGIADAAASVRGLLNRRYVLTIKGAEPIAGAKVEIGFAPGSKRAKLTLRYRGTLQRSESSNIE